MDKEKAYVLFKKLLKEFHESDMTVRNDRGLMSYEKEEAELDGICEKYDSEMRKYLGLD